jgi:hypothetical protein
MSMKAWLFKISTIAIAVFILKALLDASVDRFQTMEVVALALIYVSLAANLMSINRGLIVLNRDSQVRYSQLRLAVGKENGSNELNDLLKFGKRIETNSIAFAVDVAGLVILATMALYHLALMLIRVGE